MFSCFLGTHGGGVYPMIPPATIWDKQLLFQPDKGSSIWSWTEVYNVTWATGSTDSRSLSR